MSDEKTYVGHIKQVKTQYGTLLSGFLDLDVLNKYGKKLGDSNVANITILQRKEPSKNGFTHYAIIDKYEPKEKAVDNENIPF